MFQTLQREFSAMTRAANGLAAKAAIPTADSDKGTTADARRKVISAARPRNMLLRGLSAQDFALIRPRLERSTLQAKDVLEEVNGPIEYAYFPEDSLISVIATQRDGKAIEVGMVGREGMTGTAIVLGNGEALNECRVQLEGSALRIPAAGLRELLSRSASLHAQFLRYMQVVLVQATQTALVNSHLTVEKRLARWLLMMHDRVGENEFDLTHEFLAAMLGVRRPGVTVALHMLEGRHLIRSTRSHIGIRDRAGLEEFVASGYGIPEEHYRRLFPGAGF
jgi:CRP-like cAMP-binding protein